MLKSGVTAAVVTLGCRVNQAESSVIEGTLRHHGIAIIPVEEKPSFCIINTCTVTGKSDANSRQIIRRAAREGSRVIVTGCYSQLNRDDVLRMDGVDHVVPIENKEKIVGIVLGQETEALYQFHDRARPYLKVQDGCNFACSYCAVPMARGRSRSLSPESAVERAGMIEAEGYHEIVLTGIHLGSYGRDLSEQTSLAKLLKNIIKRTGIRRIRLSSLEINEVDDELLEVLHDERVCRHLHLPLQSGSNAVLAMMNRNYSADHFTRKMTAITDMFRDIAIGSDVIVGFPGERNEDFEDTCRMVEELPFAYLHIFPYSPRAGTAAAKMRRTVPNAEVTERAAALKRLSRGKRELYAKTHLNRTLDVIAEEDDGQGHTLGTASNYLKIRVSGDDVQRGTLIFVRPTEIESSTLTGFVVA